MDGECGEVVRQRIVLGTLLIALQSFGGRRSDQKAQKMTYWSQQFTRFDTGRFSILSQQVNIFCA